MLDIEERLLQFVRRVYQQERETVVTCCGTTATECQIITEVGRSGTITVTELGRRMGVDKGWVSRAVDGLVQSGMLEKSASEIDRRTVAICLSASGEDKCCELKDSLRDLIADLIQQVPEAKRDMVKEAIALLDEAAEAIAQPAPLISLNEIG